MSSYASTFGIGTSKVPNMWNNIGTTCDADSTRSMQPKKANVKHASVVAHDDVII